MEIAKRKANNLFTASLNAGVNLIQQVASLGGADSSDDERIDVQDIEDFMSNGSRGVLSFPVTSQRTCRKKMLHLHLYKAKIMQYHEGKKRVYPCGDIINIEKEVSAQILMEMRQPIDLSIRQIRFLFDSDVAAEKFLQYVEFLNEFGKTIKQAFNAIDYTRSGAIRAEDLASALRRVDLHVDSTTLDQMMAFGRSGHNVLDYHAFLRVFMASFVSSLHDCLQEWLNLTIESSGELSLSGQSGPVKVVNSSKSAINMLSGEEVTFSPRDRVHWCVFVGKATKEPFFIPGHLIATNYRIVLTSSRRAAAQQQKPSRYDLPAFFSRICLPLSAVVKYTIAAPRHSIYITCKDYRVLRVTLSASEATRQRVEAYLSILQKLTFSSSLSSSRLEDCPLFAFRYAPPELLVNYNTFIKGEGGNTADHDHTRDWSFGWLFSDVRRDYDRLGLSNDPQHWQVFHNKDYSLIDTYPRYLILPRGITLDEIKAAAEYRSRSRLPVVVYKHSFSVSGSEDGGGALLLRSAQPLAGITQKVCEEEQRLLEFYRMRGQLDRPGSLRHDHSRFIILDCRGIIAATLNKAAGKGTENIANYTNTELVFGNIDNIHVMRAAALTLADSLASFSSQATGIETRDLIDQNMSGYFGKLEDSGWLRFLRIILVSSVFVAEKLHFNQDSVLVHCSDGWDRTAQITSIAQILLDPFYRTLTGLATLIEKEWCAFGHKFQDRCGHGQDSNSLPDERSPVFLQFLDCVYQLLEQFPTTFQFNEELLIFLADHHISCLFGTFLGNSERERVAVLDAPSHTISIWDYIMDEKRLFNFLNSQYVHYPQPLWPQTSLFNLKLWQRYWLRWDSVAHPNTLQQKKPWHDDWGNGYETIITTTSAATSSNVSKSGISSSTPTPPPPPRSPLQRNPPPPPPSTPIQQSKLPLERKHVSISTNSTESFIMIAASGTDTDSPYQRVRSWSSLSPTKPSRRKIVSSSSSAASLENVGWKEERTTEEAAAFPSSSPLPPSLATADSTTTNPIRLARKSSSEFKQPFGKLDGISSTMTVSQISQEELSAVLLKRLHRKSESNLTTKSSPTKPSRRKIVSSSSSAASLENVGWKEERTTEEAAAFPSSSPLPPSLTTAHSTTTNPIQLARKSSSEFKQPFGKLDRIFSASITGNSRLHN